MKPIRFLMIGGFLGAGKTTAIARLARTYMDAGKRVGLVTNDQAYGLVDTESLRAQGFNVGEVPGACFCCKFEDLVETASSLSADETPDVIITEPVGSCTDLVATVIEPLRQLHGDRYELGPLAVLLKPEHGLKILRNEKLGFSPKAAYIFLKQIEEADVVAINKIDKLAESDVRELIGLVEQRFPTKEVVAVSAREGTGFESLLATLNGPTRQHSQFMDVDYDIYAEGEAELGWLNCQVAFQGGDSNRFALDELILSLIRALRDLLVERDLEPAHLKVMGQTGTDSAIANLVDSGTEVELSLASEIRTADAEVLINARVSAAPETLENVVEQAVSIAATTLQLNASISGMQRFRPGRPEPTHRMTSS
jgi:Ni2+-binding GTPase involved in maturation of urease and hydrogenase